VVVFRYVPTPVCDVVVATHPAYKPWINSLPQTRRKQRPLASRALEPVGLSTETSYETSPSRRVERSSPPMQHASNSSTTQCTGQKYYIRRLLGLAEVAKHGFDWKNARQCDPETYGHILYDQYPLGSIVQLATHNRMLPRAGSSCRGWRKNAGIRQKLPLLFDGG